ncbi:Leucine-rich repeat and calponin like proteiny domain-containing protein 4 [Myotis brandtii]|uniref:Leucine-rich repeat and calponin homology domain-containing protein 4 n=1 Tax=Myotis brandtii TaxID=109478 RepID=S7PXI0_MYOBR|nr:Leucine-rich repeat and calponin like proteiny domain-containing protein 4 [Myotis brandtii]
MAAAIAASFAAGGEEAAATTSVPGSLGLPGSRSAERALEEAVATGTLNLSNRRLKHFPRGAARTYDLSDITQADLSRNRFPEVPEAACQLVSLEGLSLYHNCLRCLNPALGNLTALTYLNLSRNQLSSLPPYICQLPLRVLIVSNNKLGALPPDISTLGSLRQLDVSSNELQSLPTELCSLPSLRDLNVRRNQLSTLPDELGDLPLVRLDFSCNRISRIPVSFCRLRHLQVILLDSNPLQSPPAQICLKGKLHIFKYLSTEAGRRGGAALGDLAPSRPPSFSPWTDQLFLAGPSPAEDLFPGRRYDGGLDSGFHSVDSGSKRWSGNESTDDFSELSFRISELAREPRGPRERKEDGCADGDPEQIDFIDSHVPGEDEERGAAKVLESRLQRPLPEDLAEALANGVILCQLANQLRPRSVPFIHVPSPAVPKLSTLKSRKNVESFLEACRKMGVPEADLCSPSDLLQGTAQGLWTTLEAVKRVGGRAPPPLWPPSGLGGFILFYVVLMLLLYVVYTQLLGS